MAKAAKKVVKGVGSIGKTFGSLLMGKPGAAASPAATSLDKPFMPDADVSTAAMQMEALRRAAARQGRASTALTGASLLG